MPGSVAIVNGNAEAMETESGQGVGPPKTAKQLEKEARKLAKLEKFKQKQDKQRDPPAQTKEKFEVCNFAIGSKSFSYHMVVK